MKNILFFCFGIYAIITNLSVLAQEADTAPGSKWNHDIEGWFYILKNDFIFSPVYAVDKNWLHLEARYNYEDIKTFSAWFGYNFSGGNKFQFTITPMLGGVIGNTQGIAPGLEFDFEFSGFELSSESEYLFDMQDRENDFYYNWTDFTYSPLDWLWFGLSVQRTALYHTDLELQRGFLLGGGYKWLGLTAYLFNPGTDDINLVLFLSITLPEN